MRGVFLFFIAAPARVVLPVGGRPLRVFVAAGWHGREWATSELSRALERCAAANATRSEWRFVHEVGPWSARRARTPSGACTRTNERGVDLNRNFLPPLNCTRHSQGRRGGEEYGGERPFSEAETRAVRDALLEFEPDVALFLHTGDDAIVLPYDACFEMPAEPLHTRQVKLARKLAEAVGGVRRLGAGLPTMYPAEGTAMDWAYEHARVPFVYTLETYRTPQACADDSLLQKATDAMTPEECERTFVPRSDRACARSDLAGYLARWTRLVDAVEALLHDPADRRTLDRWLSEATR